MTEPPSVAQEVRAFIDGHPAIREALALGVVNYSALARHIMEVTGSDQEDAILAACRRHEPPVADASSSAEAFAQSRLEVRTNVGLLTLRPDWDLLATVARTISSLREREERVHVLQGWQAMTLVADEAFLDDLRRAVGATEVLEERRGLAELNVHSPDVQEVPGFVAMLTGCLAGRGINVLDVTTCNQDHVLLVDQEDLAAAVEAINGRLAPTATPA
ncbi:MAG: DUF7523 family protein [Thermoplasmatota archaeon]